jgi:hypothetical protein
VRPPHSSNNNTSRRPNRCGLDSSKRLLESNVATELGWGHLDAHPQPPHWHHVAIPLARGEFRAEMPGGNGLCELGTRGNWRWLDCHDAIWADARGDDPLCQYGCGDVADRGVYDGSGDINVQVDEDMHWVFGQRDVRR